MPWSGWSTSSDPLKPKKTSVADEVPNFFGRTPQAADLARELNFPKVPGADPYIKQAFDFLKPLGESFKADTDRFRSEIMRTQPELEGYNTQETNDITRLFTPGGYEQQFADIRGRRKEAMGGLADAIMGDLRKVLNLNARGGVGGTGLGSYLTSTAASQAGRLRTDEIFDAAAQERSDLAALMAGRSGAYGKRQGLTDSLLARLLQPAQAEAAGGNAWTAQLQQALNAAIANLVQAWGLQPS